MEINQINEAELLIFLNKLAKDIGMDAVSARYFEEMDKLVDKTFKELIKIWQIENEIKG